MVGQNEAAGWPGDRGRGDQRAPLSSGALARAVPALDAQHPRLEHLAAAVARAPGPGLDLCQRPCDRLSQGSAVVRAVRRPPPDPGPGRPRYLVLVIAVAVRDAGVAERH